MSLINVNKFSYKYHKLYEKNQEFLKKSKVPEQTKGYLRCMEDTMCLLSNADTVEWPRGEWKPSWNNLNESYCSHCNFIVRNELRSYFCPKCGVPMTDEALEILAKRLGDKERIEVKEQRPYVNIDDTPIGGFHDD